MPTQMDFEHAAHKFEIAAQGVGAITSAVESVPASLVLQGGRLGQHIPEGIARSSATATSCQAVIEAKAQICRERATVIANYEIELARYDQQFEGYMQREWAWSMRYLDWWDGVADYPGQRPVRPNAPAPPPAWADVRRPQ